MSQTSKYDPVARRLLQDLDAVAVIVVVLGGNRGHGAAGAMVATTDPEELAAIREMQAVVLRSLADDIERGVTQPDQPEHRRGSAS